MLKRILDKQLELNEYEPFGGGVYWEHLESKDNDQHKYVKLQNNKDMGFLEEIQELTANHKSPKLDDVKFRIKKHAANGERKMTLDHSLYDNYVQNWLRAQGFSVIETFDQRDGDFITITW